MSLTLRHAALFYSGGDAPTVNAGVIAPPLEEIVAAGDSLIARGEINDLIHAVSGAGSTDIIGVCTISQPIAEVSGGGTSQIALGAINDFLPVVSGSGSSEALGGDVVITPPLEQVAGIGSIQVSVGLIEQRQEISGSGSGMIVGYVRIEPNKDSVSGTGNSAFVAVKGPMVLVPPKESIVGFGYAGDNVGAGVIDGKVHVVAASGTSDWTHEVAGDGAIIPRRCIVSGQGTSEYAASYKAIGRIKGKKHVISSRGSLPVYGYGSVYQRTKITSKGTVSRAESTLSYVRDTAVAATSSALDPQALSYHRGDVATSGGTNPPAINPLQFSR